MISSITGRGTARFMVFKGSFTTTVFIMFLEQLANGSNRVLYPIVDGHPVHKSRPAGQYAMKS
jgi:hypothetical protein